MCQPKNCISQTFEVSTAYDGMRLDKFLAKYMDKAPKSFFYKMLRKKNITLNEKRATGKEILNAIKASSD